MGKVGGAMNILEYENYQETKSHYSVKFPYNTYLCTIPLDFQIVPAHWHNEMEIIYVKKGLGKVNVDFYEYVVKEGDIIIIIPGQLHSIMQKEDFSMEYENIIFNPELLQSKVPDNSVTDFFMPLMNRKISLPTFINEDFPDYVEVSGILDKIDGICGNFPKGYELAIRAGLLNLFFILFSKYGIENDRKSTVNKSLEKIKVVIKYIEENYANEISVEDMAEELEISSSHFMKLFKNNMHTSFINYLNEYRLSMAAKLLISSNSNIMDISMECGFNNLSYFNRSFKTQYDVTPRQYRELYGKH